MNIQDWKTKVIAYNEQLNQQLKNNEAVKNLYYGFEVIDGKIIENPEILFVGINPGKGGGNPHYEVIFESEQVSYLDVFDEGYLEDYEKGYALAEFSIGVLKKIGIKDIISYFQNKCVKTNLKHIITGTEPDIKKTLQILGSESYGDYYNMSNELCMDLIKTLKPKLVIFEGKSVYDCIITDCYEQIKTWNYNDDYGYYFDAELNCHYLGYKRNAFGGVDTKEDVIAEKILDLNLF